MKKGMLMVLAAVAVIMVVGMLILLIIGSISIGDIFRVLSNLNSRVIALIALPFIIVAVGIGWLYARKREDRMWKQAVSRTRAARQTGKKES